jgi:curved DNA-binding protein
MAKDYYQTLGVRRDASQAEIQKAYRDLARKYHPDMNPDDKNAKKKFQDIQAAFDVLNDAGKRELYDRYGSSFETMGAGGPGGAHAGTTWRTGPGTGPSGGFRFEDVDFSQFLGERYGAEPGGGGFADLFEQFRQTGGRSRRGGASKAARGADIEHELSIPFTTSITGGEATIAIGRQSGKVETLAVKIPPGIEDGKKIRLRGQGEPASRGKKPGDVLLTVRVSPHACFQRRGNHLHLTVPVTLAEAALGAKIDIPTPKGAVSLRIPPAASSGTKLRVKGMGVPARGDTPAGDLLAEVQIVLPKDLDEPSREMIRKIQERYPQEPRATLRW